MYIYMYICIYISMSITLSAPGGHPGGQARVQECVLPVTWTPPLYFWRTKEQRTGQMRSLRFTQVGLLQLQRD